MTTPDASPPMRPPRLADALNTAIVVLDARDRPIYLNSAAEQFWDTSFKAIAKQGFRPFFNLNTELSATIAEARASAQVMTLRELEITITHGQTRIADCAITPEPGIEGASLLLEFTDIERHVRISREAQSHAMQISTRQLVRGLAHELKNPLGGVQGAAQLLARELPDAALREYTEIILAETHRLKTLIDRMLGPNQRPQPTLINIHDPLEQVRRLLSIEAEKIPLTAPLRWVLDFDPSLPELWADRDQLMQILLNLGRNALQAMSEHATPAPTLRLRTRVLRQFTIHQTRHRLLLAVDLENNGPPVPDGLMETLFLPMVSGRAHGSGLGLSIAQTLAEQHQGMIEFRQAPGAVTFTLILPFRTPAAAATESPR
ncbi:nitrogen regulation protein NR(II) [Halothiobacillus sp. DCM-1]|uniref:nitrogen regulation protein NR(II) n=1 Tax=Halothiobacillus sp. DCM-1 TaxID=3112558 RepID=UPI0032500FDE